jgi:hypothetical protein
MHIKFLLEILKRPLRRTKHKLENNIKINIKKIRWQQVKWINLAHGRDWWQTLVNNAANF